MSECWWRRRRQLRIASLHSGVKSGLLHSLGRMIGTDSWIAFCTLRIKALVASSMQGIPSPSENYREILIRKIRWGILAVLAPDILGFFSALQWHRAKASVSQMHSIGHTNWTLRHAFYANSGGFVLKSDDFKPIPLTAASIYYLVATSQIECPTISKAEIWENSKADTFAKGAALMQSMWLIVQCAARASQGLTVTPLELFSLSFVFSTASHILFLDA